MQRKSVFLLTTAPPLQLDPTGWKFSKAPATPQYYGKANSWAAPNSVSGSFQSESARDHSAPFPRDNGKWDERLAPIWLAGRCNVGLPCEQHQPSSFVCDLRRNDVSLTPPSRVRSF